MKIGDLVRYNSDDIYDDVIGIITKVILHGLGAPRANVVWSLCDGTSLDEVPLRNLEVISESR